MASWRDEYIKALSERDERERASYSRISEDFIDAFTNLLERTAALEAEKGALLLSKPEALSKDRKDKTKDPVTASDEGNAQIKSDLAEALRSNGHLQTRVRNAEAELVELRVRTKADAKRIAALEKERAGLIQKVRDRDEEIRGKARFLENTQDEMISLELQLNVSEQNAKKLKAENKELIDRWMARKESEADEMNNRLR